MKFLIFGEIVDQLQHVDDSDVLEQAKTNWALAEALRMSRPANWHGIGFTPQEIIEVAEQNAIPVVWVPSREILAALVSANPSDRMSVLRSERANVVAQCVALLQECDDPWLEGDVILTGRAIDALNDGHHEAAMALAVAVGEPLAIWISQRRVQVFDTKAELDAWEKKKRNKRYELAKAELAAVGPPSKFDNLWVLRRALIAPIPKFFTPFFPDKGHPIPETVSRHATVHQPTVKHLNADNALLAIMLCVSILRAQQEFCEEVRHDMHADEE